MKLNLTKTREDWGDFQHALSYEWLETNGLGGYAFGSIFNLNTRRYHGLLVVALHPPTDRMVLVSKMDETIMTGNENFELGCNDYGEVIHPNGNQFLLQFKKDIFPEWIYEADGIQLKKTIAMIQDENITVITYEVLACNQDFSMELQPLFAVRDYHSLMHFNEKINPDAKFENGTLQVNAYDQSPEIFISAPGSSFSPQPDWYFNFNYVREKERGFDSREDLFSYGKFSLQLKNQDKIAVIISTENNPERDGFELVNQERARRESLLKNIPPGDAVKYLVLGADQFIVRKNENLKSVIVGYPWFTDWTRDAMISLPGLCLATGRLDDAKKILSAFAKSASEGMLPNCFPDLGETPEYNNADGTLWFFVAIHQYAEAGGDKDFVLKELLPVLKDILDWHFKGTRYHIHVDADGLLFAGEEGVQLTWMDAKTGDRVLTPRIGKPVEVNALWYNALRIYADFCKKNGDRIAFKEYRQKAREVKKKFNEVFWNEEKQYLFDVINGEEKNASLRPNQLFAITLPYSLPGRKKSKTIFRVVAEKLYTPFGLRTLSPDDPKYIGTYDGDAIHRDEAYHQGTAWSWLLGAYIDALMRTGGKRSEAREVMNAALHHLEDACLGQVSEIFDGNEPFRPNGCVAQAWGVAEWLRVIIQYKLFEKKAEEKALPKMQEND